MLGRQNTRLDTLQRDKDMLNAAHNTTLGELNRVRSVASNRYDRITATEMMIANRDTRIAALHQEVSGQNEKIADLENTLKHLRSIGWY